jgi:hypothetical protein
VAGCLQSRFFFFCRSVLRRLRRLELPFTQLFDSIVKAMACFGWAFHVKNFVLLPFQVVIVDETFFEFLDELLARFPDVPDMSITVIGFFDGDDAIVAFAFFLFALPALDNADNAAFEQASGEGWLIHEHQHVGRIAVPAFVEGTKPRSWGKLMPAGSTLFRATTLWSGSNAYLLRLPLGVSMMTWTSALPSIAERSTGSAKDGIELSFSPRYSHFLHYLPGEVAQHQFLLPGRPKCFAEAIARKYS